jgi:hypothetical protein
LAPFARYYWIGIDWKNWMGRMRNITVKPEEMDFETFEIRKNDAAIKAIEFRVSIISMCFLVSYDQVNLFRTIIAARALHFIYFFNFFSPFTTFTFTIFFSPTRNDSKNVSYTTYRKIVTQYNKISGNEV